MRGMTKAFGVTLAACLLCGAPTAMAETPAAAAAVEPAPAGLNFLHHVTISVDVQAKLDQARTMVQEGKDLPMAIEMLHEIEKLSPDLTEAFYWEAVAHNAQEEYNAADRAYENALMIEPDNAGLYYYRGLNYQQQFESNHMSYYRGMADRFFEHALRLTPDYLDAKIGLADCKYFDGYYEEAMKSYNQLLALYPNNSVLQTRKEDCQKKLDETEAQEKQRELKNKINS